MTMNSIPNEHDKTYLISAINWTPELLLETRESLGLTRKYVADIFEVSVVTIRNLEMHKVKNQLAIIAYGNFLERYKAYQDGYIHAYRKIGEQKFMEGDIFDDGIK